MCVHDYQIVHGGVRGQVNLLHGVSFPDLV